VHLICSTFLAADPACDIMGNPAAHTQPGGDFCGAAGGNFALFGSTVNPRTVNPDVLEGWGIRPWDWQVTASVQQELIARLAVEVGFTRRWWGNFFVDDNLNLGPEHFDVVTITAPMHPDLPGGGGYPVSFRVPNASPQTANWYTFASDYGRRTAAYTTWNTNINARTRWGLVMQGGTTTGRGVRDECEIVAVLPEVAGNGSRIDACSVTESWKTTFRGLASYNVPRIDVLVSSVMRSQPGQGAVGALGSGGNGLSATYNVPNAVVQEQLGRPLINNATQVGVNLLLPGEMYQKRLNTFDVRFAKVLRFGRQRTDIGIDLYNIINDNTQTGYNTNFGNDGTEWLRPTAVRAPRFVRFNVTYHF
jgi:hypothetical protein